jgi:hypothetical protein
MRIIRIIRHRPRTNFRSLTGSDPLECRCTSVRHPRGRKKAMGEAFVEPEIGRCHVDQEFETWAQSDAFTIRRGVEVDPL